MGGGGAERQLCYLVEGMARAGHESTVVLVRGGPNYLRLRRANTRVIRLSMKFGYIGVAVQIFRLLRRERPVLVQTWLSNMDILGGFAAMISGVPFIIGERNNRAGGYHDSWRHLHHFAALRSRGVIANSEEGLLFWRDKLGPGRLCVHVPNCVLTEEIDEVSPSFGRAVLLHRRRKWILYGGRLLESQKNISTLLECWGRLAERDPELGFVVVGAGPDRLMVSALRSQLNGRLLHFDYLPERELWAMMKRASLLMSCSRFEGAPNVVMEAMACGVPLVLSNIPEHRELADEGAAYASVNDVDAFVAAAEAVLVDSSGAMKRVSISRERIERFSLAETTKRYVTIYERLLEGENTVAN